MPRPTTFERFNAKVVTDAETGCWRWTGVRTHDGYGTLFEGYAHRVSYELFVGPIPEGLEVDHLCNNRCCVNPEHLEPVTREENIRRQVERRTHCKSGHPYTPENTYVRPCGARQCRACNAAAVRRYQKRRAVA